MLVVAALGGNALLKRGEPLTADNQRANVRTAMRGPLPKGVYDEAKRRLEESAKVE